MASKMPTAEGGTVQKFKDARGRTYWRARITLPDGARVWLPSHFDKRERAEDYAAEKTAEAHRRGLTVAKAAPTKASGETCDDWHERYLEACEARGVATVRNKRNRWSKWISPRLGDKRPRDVTRDDVEDVRDALDDAIRDGRLAWKTAANVWGELSVAFAEMLSAKRRELRAVDADPSAGVRAPETGSTPSKVYPYPSEFLAVVSCEAVPLAWRELHAIAAYTFLRPGELYVLEWSDVDLDDRKIHVTKAWDFDRKRLKSTKTDEHRHPPIEPELLPLLRAMRERAGGVGLVAPQLAQSCEDDWGMFTRRHFHAAGCERPRLHVKTRRRWDLVFRSWRDAGITWSIVRGDDVVKVQRRAGHKRIDTTMGYVVEAENAGATFGVPFAPLPLSLLRASKAASNDGGPTLQATGTDEDSSCEGGDLNPHGSPR